MTDILRKALILLSKLKIPEFKEWVIKELNGYSNDDKIPDYRVVQGELKGYNPIYGLVPVLIDDSEMEKILNTRKLTQSIPELEDLVSNSNEKSLHINVPDNIPMMFNIDSKVILKISSSQIVKIIENVRTKLLDWTLSIENDEPISNELILLEDENKSLPTIPISNNVFIVHGHNELMKQSVARLISKLKLNPIILHELPNKGKTIIEKFSDNSDVAFAIVLISADDFAYAKNDKEENGKYRARQNVIFELGYFIGKLGRERVLTLFETENDIEILSDYTGVLFVPYDNLGKWQLDIVKELKAIGISVDANDIF